MSARQSKYRWTRYGDLSTDQGTGAWVLGAHLGYVAVAGRRSAEDLYSERLSKADSGRRMFGPWWVTVVPVEEFNDVVEQCNEDMPYLTSDVDWAYCHRMLDKAKVEGEKLLGLTS